MKVFSFSEAFPSDSDVQNPDKVRYLRKIIPDVNEKCKRLCLKNMPLQKCKLRIFLNLKSAVFCFSEAVGDKMERLVDPEGSGLSRSQRPHWQMYRDFLPREHQPKPSTHPPPPL